MNGYCDTCSRNNRKDVRPMGKDSSGDPDAPDMCFICRVEYSRGKGYDRNLNKYVKIDG